MIEVPNLAIPKLPCLKNADRGHYLLLGSSSHGYDCFLHSNEMLPCLVPPMVFHQPLLLLGPQIDDVVVEVPTRSALLLLLFRDEH